MRAIPLRSSADDLGDSKHPIQPEAAMLPPRCVRGRYIEQPGKDAMTMLSSAFDKTNELPYEEAHPDLNEVAKSGWPTMQEAKKDLKEGYKQLEILILRQSANSRKCFFKI